MFIPPARSWSPRLARLGDWLLHHQGVIRHTQWAVVVFYLVLVALPAFLPLPPGSAHLWNNLTLAAQFAFWGIWWPFVLLSMVLVGRAWCGFFCPEGALTERVSRFSLGRQVPRWISWRGWPFVAFVCTTIYGQMVSVYQYPKPALLILGGSTVAAVAVGLIYGRNKRVWCRYLCPVNGVFTLLAKLAPLHYRVDAEIWHESQRRHEPVPPITCAPLVPIRTMKGAGSCHMCGRCSGMRGAVALSLRPPNHEIVEVAGLRADQWQTVLILFGLMGVAYGAFDWPTSPWFVMIKQALAEFLVDHGMMGPLELSAPWWVATNYAERNDVLTLLDAGLIVGYIVGAAAIMGSALAGCLALANAALGGWSWSRFHHLAQTLIPLAGAGIFLGLSGLTVSLLRAEGVPTVWVGSARVLILGGAALWSCRLAWQVAGRHGRGWRRGLAAAGVGIAAAVAVAGWAALFWG